MNLPRRRILLWGGAAGLAAVAAGLTVLMGDPPPPRTIRLATGDRDGAYFVFGQTLAEKLIARGLGVEVIETTGSVRNAEMLESREAYVAFAHAGVITSTGAKGIAVIAKIYSEPLWVFYRANTPLHTLSELVPGPDTPPKRISIGADGSGTQPVALELLRQSGVTADNATFLKLDQSESVEAMRKGEVDVVIRSGAPTAPSVQSLLHMEGVRLVDFKNHRSYSRRLPYLEGLAIEPGMLSLQDDLPTEPMALLASNAMLLTRTDAHPRVVEMVLQAATEIFAGGNLIDAPGDFPSAHGLEVPQHEAAARYMKDGESWWSRHLSFTSLWLLSRSKVLAVPALTVLPLIRFLPLLRGWFTRRKVSQRYEALQAAEVKLQAAKTLAETTAAIDAIRELRDEVAELSLDLPPAHVAVAYSFREHATLVLGEAKEQLEMHAKAEGRSEKTAHPEAVPDGARGENLVKTGVKES